MLHLQQKDNSIDQARAIFVGAVLKTWPCQQQPLAVDTENHLQLSLSQKESKRGKNWEKKKITKDNKRYKKKTLLTPLSGGRP